MTQKTIKNVSDSIVDELKRYIRSQYNISNPFVVKQREEILDELGAIQQEPFIENTPKYKTGERFSSLQLPTAFTKIIKQLSQTEPKLIFDPPYTHQLDSVRNTVIEKKSSVVMTGTGSGKTESFLWPILGKLANEADNDSGSFKKDAVRALVLYPMNALVNDQLGRMRDLFGDERLKSEFLNLKSERIPTFARYTSRTPYAGKRESKKDKKKFEGYEKFYVKIESEMDNPDSPNREKRKALFRSLKNIGKWPAKPSISDWYNGRSGNPRWGDQGDRLKKHELDSELLSRHEVQQNPPDVLITNFSMLSYMMLRPLENNIFSKTKSWLKNHPEEKFLIVFDEAHLYMGSQGAEVSLLIRRLINRLGIKQNQLQIILTSASFSDTDKARKFASTLSSVDINQFEVLKGEYDQNKNVRKMNEDEIEVFLSINASIINGSENTSVKVDALRDFFDLRAIGTDDIENDIKLQASLFKSLIDFPPLNKLINSSMGNAISLDEMRDFVLPESVTRENSHLILANMIAMASYAKESPKGRSLFPSRLHLFLRGLPGLWACLNKNCDQIDLDDRGNTIGKLYSQPREKCACGSNIFEYYTCRYCGSDYAKAYIDEVENDATANQPLMTSYVETFISDNLNEGHGKAQFREFDILLKEIDPGRYEPSSSSGIQHNIIKTEFDPKSSRLQPRNPSDCTRTVIYPDSQKSNDDDWNKRNARRFLECPVCRENFYIDQNASPVQDHMTKGVEPLKAIATETLNTQPESIKADLYKPLGGRKLLFFSDSREKAASLVKRFDDFGVSDAIRPMIALGYKTLLQKSSRINLESIYDALLIGSAMSNVRLRFYNTPETYISNEQDVFKIFSDYDDDDERIQEVQRERFVPDEKIIPDLIKPIFNPQFGLYPMAVAQLREVDSDSFNDMISQLTDIQNLAENENEKKNLVRIWLYYWAISRHGASKQKRKPWFNFMNSSLWDLRPEDEYHLVGMKPNYIPQKLRNFLKKFKSEKIFEDSWNPLLFEHFTEHGGYGEEHKLLAKHLTLSFDDENWGICDLCRWVQVKAPNHSECINCSSGSVLKLDPNHDEVFIANNDYTRRPIIEALQNNVSSVFSITTKEHTAQLNATSTATKIFSEAEENELTFQDISFDERFRTKVSTDVLSSTTTMEVGIDIGALSAVGLRGMPPARSNYQQRAGRAGRRGNSIATVVSWGNVDSHDEHYFSQPREMISGHVRDPFINLNNVDITERHVLSYILEKFIESLDHDELNDRDAGVFSVLGKVTDFRNNDPNNPITLSKLKAFIGENENELRDGIINWVPEEIKNYASLTDFNYFIKLLEESTDDYKIFELFRSNNNQSEISSEEDSENYFEHPERPDAEENSRGEKSSYIDPKKNELISRLIYKGILPKYGFPSDVVSFYVFSKEANARNKYDYQYQPSQALASAIRIYAPGETTTIGGKIYKTYGLYSLDQDERKSKYDQSRSLYTECSTCGYSEIDNSEVEKLKEKKSNDPQVCIICNSNTFGPPKYRFEPTGFTHGYQQKIQDNYLKKILTPETRIKTYYKPDQESILSGKYSEFITSVSDRGEIYFTNPGPDNKGFDYCYKCGHASIAAEQSMETPHTKPYPDQNGSTCDAEERYISRGTVLGTEFKTDLLWLCFDLTNTDIELKPFYTPTKIVLTTVATALATAATRILQVDPSEISAHYKHSEGQEGLNGKIFEFILYDNLANGAGYSNSSELNTIELINKAIELLKECPSDCDSSCYRCLRQYHNKYSHHLYDRYLGQLFLETCLTGKIPEYDDVRINQSINSLKDDLQSFQFEGEVITNNEIQDDGKSYTIPITIKINGNEDTYFSLSNPLTKNKLFDDELQKWKIAYAGQIKPINELEIRRSLKNVTQRILQKEND